jgi:hypothetical protein
VATDAAWAKKHTAGVGEGVEHAAAAISCLLRLPVEATRSRAVEVSFAFAEVLLVLLGSLKEKVDVLDILKLWG